MVLRLGEAFGVSKEMVRRALTAAKSAQRHPASEAAAIGRIIPWEMVEHRLQTTIGGNRKPTVAKQAKGSVSWSVAEDCVYAIAEDKELARLFASNKTIAVLFGDAANSVALLTRLRAPDSINTAGRAPACLKECSLIV
jgi:hypothetical protein